MKKTALSMLIFVSLLNTASGAIIGVNNSSALPGAVNHTLVNLSGMDNFGVADIDLYYDPGIVNVTSASLGFSGYGGSLTPNIDNTAGKATFLVIITDIPGPNSPLTLLNVSLKAVGSGGQTGALGLVVSTFADTDGSPPASLTVNNGTFKVLSTPDTTAPASITGLVNTSYAPNYINWTWTDPGDADFSKVMVYLGGAFQTNVSKGVHYYNATGLTAATTYTIATRTVDTTGNINTTWVNHTARTALLPDTAPPASVTGLHNITNAQNYINWTWNDPDDSDFDKVMVYINGTFKTNITKGIQYYNATDLTYATSYAIATRTVDTLSNINQTWINYTAITAAAPDPAISINNASAYAGENTSTLINLSGMDNFGVATIDLFYDASVVNVTNASLGFSGYGGSLTSNINNTIGKTRFVITTTDRPGPNSPLMLLNVSLKAVGSGGQTSSLGMVVPTLADTDGNHVNATVNNGTFTVLTTAAPAPPSSSGSSGGGGGGGGGGGTSGENFSNIELKEKYDLFINKDKTTPYCFRNAGNPIICINITGSVNAGDINTAVEVLRNISSLVKTQPEGLVYKNVNMWVGTYGFATPQNIKEGVITFRVSRSWIDENGIDPASIVLLRYSGAWNALPTEKISENAQEIYYKATTSRFSPFAIEGRKLNGKNLVPQTASNTESQQKAKPVNTGGNKTGASESSSGLSKYLVVGAFIGIVLNAALIYRYKFGKSKDIFNK